MKHLQEMIRVQNDIALGFTAHIFQAKASDSNFVFSPLSIQALLSLIATGSSGATLDQLLSFLRSTSIDHLSTFASQVVDFVFADGSHRGGPRLSFAYGLWIDSSATLKHSFKHMVDHVYKAACMQADFINEPGEAIKMVNSWCEKETNGLIKNVLPPGSVNRSTRLILANALYFKGAWNKKFDTSKTRDEDFHLLNHSSVKVPFMTSMKHQKACSHSGFKVLGLPYQQGEDSRRRFTMYFFLPDAKDGLPALIEKVGSESGFLDRYLPSRYVRVNLKIPKFKTEFEFEASNILRGLGVAAPFEGGLTEMVNPPLISNLLYVSSVFHKAFIEVNEEGTEAAAVTAATMCMGTGRSTLKLEIIDFVADHPFLYMIREDETGVVLFVGHLLNPLHG